MTYVSLVSHEGYLYALRADGYLYRVTPDPNPRRDCELVCKAIIALPTATDAQGTR